MRYLLPFLFSLIIVLPHLVGCGPKCGMDAGPCPTDSGPVVDAGPGSTPIDVWDPGPIYFSCITSAPETCTTEGWTCCLEFPDQDFDGLCRPSCE